MIVDRVMSTIESTSGQYVDFILCMGDDLSDEFMFQYLEDARSRPNMFTVTVGKKPSAAKYFVNDVDQVMEIVHAMTKVSTAAKRNFSMNDLRLFDRNVTSRYYSIHLLTFFRCSTDVFLLLIDVVVADFCRSRDKRLDSTGRRVTWAT